MKKAKIILIAIVIFTVASGALAVKANRFGGVIYINNPQNQCVIPMFNDAITTIGGFIVSASPIPLPGPCPLARIIPFP
ncbi:hypothetical protein SAMN05428988_1484 [Chitinophaga sp. YR573]|uniref:hypothetical protein n=1 Tax=Chitinophaga sp. YR573 TaxID=1881040 RepID=UPI0008B82BF9|nr:hypothetical protein [Chitinophaga sp. YR573]SEW03868.1 hypothetical protein SAMN05428988_1484 [Chitinophaga sp. YR573]